MRYDAAVQQQSMRAGHKVRKFRRGNDPHGGRAYLGRKQKPWKSQSQQKESAA